MLAGKGGRRFVLVPADAAAVGGVERFDPQCNLVVFHLVTLAVFGSERIRFSSPHGNSDGVATRASRDSKHGMLDPDKTVIGDPVPLILRRWLQTWRPCFTAPSWEHVLVLVMGALRIPTKWAGRTGLKWATAYDAKRAACTDPKRAI